MDRDAALRELPPPYAVALRLRDRGAGDAEIAEIVGISPDALAAHFRLAEAKLARLMEPSPEGSPLSDGKDA
jgi:DNA-directed RNA polymerase specialized sigma24 family protein